MSITDAPIVSLNAARDIKADDEEPVLTGKERRESERAIRYWEKKCANLGKNPTVAALDLGEINSEDWSHRFVIAVDPMVENSSLLLYGSSFARLLDLPRSGGEAQFVLRIGAGGKYWLFTQHLPEEFALTLTDGGGEALTPRVHRNFDPGHSHDARVGSFSIETDRPIVAARFQAWLTHTLQTQGTGLYRLKGFLNFEGVNERIVIQGVHMVVDTSSLGPWGDRPRKTQLVFIGRELDQQLLRQGFDACMSAPA